MIPELRDLSYESRLLQCGLTTLETRRLRGDQIEVFKIVNGYEDIKHNYLSRNFVFLLNISTASRSLLQQTVVTDVSHDQCHVTQAGVGLVGAPGQRLDSA